MAADLEVIYANRFAEREASREMIWRTLVSAYFQRFVDPTDTVLDLAAGMCEFINNVRCGAKIAVDLNPAVKQRAAEDVRVCTTRATELPDDLTGSVDVVWISNFLEHLADLAELVATLDEVHRVLRPNGRVLVLQPNIRLTKEAYWHIVDHTLPLTEKSLAEALSITGFEVERCRTRFLPYSPACRLPVTPLLIRLYLKVPPAQWILGKETFVVARRICSGD
jgi:SAM-dependent methyltransferase